MTTDTKNIAPLPEPLDEASALALAVIASFKAFGRPDYYARAGLGTYAPASPPIAALVSAGFVSVNKARAIALTDSGRRIEKRVPARYFRAVGGNGLGRPAEDSDDERAEAAELRARVGGGCSPVVRAFSAAGVYG